MDCSTGMGRVVTSVLFTAPAPFSRDRSPPPCPPTRDTLRLVERCRINQGLHLACTDQFSRSLPRQTDQLRGRSLHAKSASGPCRRAKFVLNGFFTTFSRC